MGNSQGGGHASTAARPVPGRIPPILAGELGLPESRKELERLKKGDPGKVVCAALVKRRTAVSNDWIAERLAMGHPASMTST